MCRELQENNDCLAMLSETKSCVFLKGPSVKLYKKRSRLNFVWMTHIDNTDRCDRSVLCVCVRAHLGLSGGRVVPSTGHNFIVTGPFCLPFYAQLLIPFNQT